MFHRGVKSVLLWVENKGLNTFQSAGRPSGPANSGWDSSWNSHWLLVIISYLKSTDVQLWGLNGCSLPSEGIKPLIWNHLSHENHEDTFFQSETTQTNHYSTAYFGSFCPNRQTWAPTTVGQTLSAAKEGFLTFSPILKSCNISQKQGKDIKSLEMCWIKPEPDQSSLFLIDPKCDSVQ